MGSTARASMRALCGLTRQVAALGRAYHNSPVLSRIAQRFGIETPEGFYKFNRADVRRAFPRDKEVQYAKWLGAELGYRSAASWDQLNVDAVREHSGWGLLATYYGGSPRRFMKELVFEHLHPEPT